MSRAAQPVGRRAASTRSVRVWDPLVRLSHWTIAGAVLPNGLLVDERSAAHRWIGHAALGVLAMRLLLGVIGVGAARFSAFPPSLAAVRAHARALLAGRAPVHVSHNPLGALIVYDLWGALALTSATGIMMGGASFAPMGWVMRRHEAFADWLLLSAALHVASVALEQRLSGVNLVGAMITGVKNLPDTRR